MHSYTKHKQTIDKQADNKDKQKDSFNERKRNWRITSLRHHRVQAKKMYFLNIVPELIKYIITFIKNTAIKAE